MAPVALCRLSDQYLVHYMNGVDIVIVHEDRILTGTHYSNRRVNVNIFFVTLVDR